MLQFECRCLGSDQDYYVFYQKAYSNLTHIVQPSPQLRAKSFTYLTTGASHSVSSCTCYLYV